MSTDSQDETEEGELEQAKQRAGTADRNEGDYVNSTNEPSSTEEAAPGQLSSQLPAELQEKKWKKARRFYNDQYANLLSEEVSKVGVIDDGFSVGRMQSSQIGAVTWAAIEKDLFFKALSRKGPHDTPAIALSIGTKSELEVKDYLIVLREAQAERNRCLAKPRNISHGNIPAAIEISNECEIALDRAAAAAAVYQDRFEYLAAKAKSTASWVIDEKLALKLDQEAENHEEQVLEVDELEEADAPQHLFQLSTMLELSERIFMNHGAESPHSNWRDIGSEGEYPAMTRDVILELHDLVTSITRRLMQSSLFLAQSRIRSTSTAYYKRESAVKGHDVLAAVDLLDMKADHFNYWITVARRNKLQMVHGSHDKGSTRKDVVSYGKVERALSNRLKRWRGRRRSCSTTSNGSMTDALLFESDEEESMATKEINKHATNDSPQIGSPSSLASEETEIEDADEDKPMSDAPSHSSHLSSASSDSVTGELNAISFHISTSTSSQKRRQMHLEHQQDDWLETIDHRASEVEEKRLMELLGHTMSMPEEEEGVSDLSARPKVIRKAEEDLEGWRAKVAYRAEWEQEEGMVPAQMFVRSKWANKRRKVHASDF